MKVKTLIKKLQKMDPEAEVVTVSDGFSQYDVTSVKRESRGWHLPDVVVID